MDLPIVTCYIAYGIDYGNSGMPAKSITDAFVRNVPLPKPEKGERQAEQIVIFFGVPRVGRAIFEVALLIERLVFKSRTSPPGWLR